MSAIRTNVIANYMGRIWAAATGLVVPPLLVRVLGIESYGFMGVYGAITGVLAILDLGMATTLQRELARTSAQTDDQRERTRHLVKTVEIVFWIIGLVASMTVAVNAEWLVRHWLSIDPRSQSSAVRTLQVISACLLFQWPGGVYLGGLTGLQRQVLVNVISVSIGTLRSIGGLLVVWIISPTIEALFIWTAAVMVLQVVVSRYLLWKHMPGAKSRARFDMSTLKDNWRFSAGLWGVSVVSVLLAQVDKVAATKLLTLQQFGYYTLATTIANSLTFLIGPIQTAVFPRFCQLAAARDDSDLRRLYHDSCQLMSVIILPAALVVIIDAKEVLYCWTGSSDIVKYASVPVSILAVGTAFNGLMNLPYGLQLAHGRTRVLLGLNIVSLPLVYAIVWPLGHYWGTPGIACVWAILNGGYFLFGGYLMHRRILYRETWQWYFGDIGAPLAGAMLGAFLGLAITPTHESRVSSLIAMACVGLLSTLGAAAAAPRVRVLAYSLVSRAWKWVLA